MTTAADGFNGSFFSLSVFVIVVGDTFPPAGYVAGQVSSFRTVPGGRLGARTHKNSRKGERTRTVSLVRPVSHAYNYTLDSGETTTIIYRSHYHRRTHEHTYAHERAVCTRASTDPCAAPSYRLVRRAVITAVHGTDAAPTTFRPRPPATTTPGPDATGAQELVSPSAEPGSGPLLPRRGLFFAFFPHRPPLRCAIHVTEKTSRNFSDFTG